MSRDLLSLENYRFFLKAFQEKYRFCTYDHWQESGSVLFWRHDVDFSPAMAQVLGQVEQETGVQSTFFFQFDSMFYNLLDEQVADIVRSLAAAGHRIGLHFSPVRSYFTDSEDMTLTLRREQMMLSHIAGAPVTVFSLHNPTPESLSLFTENEVEGMLNVYSLHFRNAVRYVSDSNGYWRYKTLSEVLTEPADTPLQVLTHPAWWADETLSPRERIVLATRRRQEETMQRYDNALKRDGRINR